MLRSYSALNGQSIYDVCLMTYGTLDYLFKLMQDNGFTSVNTYPYSGQVFIYDDTFVLNQAANITNESLGVNYATSMNATGASFYDINEGGTASVSAPGHIGFTYTFPFNLS